PGLVLPELAGVGRGRTVARLAQPDGRRPDRGARRAHVRPLGRRAGGRGRVARRRRAPRPPLPRRAPGVAAPSPDGPPLADRPDLPGGTAAVTEVVAAGPPARRRPAPGERRASVVIPAFREADVIASSVRRLRAELEPRLGEV